MRYLKQSTTVDVAIGPFLDATDGITAEIGLTLSQADVRLKKNNGNWAQKTETTTCTHEENGWYECPLDATDTGTLGILMLAVHESGAVPVWHEFMVLPANVYDSLFSTDKLEVDIAQFGGSNGTFSGGRPEVNTTHVGGTAQTAGDINGRIGTPANLGGGATLAANLSDIEAQTDDIGVAGAGLTALASQSSVKKIDDFLDTEIAAILAKTNQLTFTVANVLDANTLRVGGTVQTAGDVGAITAAQPEPGQGAPAANATPLQKIAYLYKAWRNRSTQTATTYSLFADDSTTVDHKATVSDNGTTFDRNEIVSGL
jgi:hypothetical protein